MQKKISKELLWLKQNAPFLSIKKIEEELHLPPTTLQQFVGKANRDIPQKWHPAITNWVIQFKKKNKA